MREYYRIETFFEVPKSRRVKQAYWDWFEGIEEYETLEEALEDLPKEKSLYKNRIVKHTKEVVYIKE